MGWWCREYHCWCYLYVFFFEWEFVHSCAILTGLCGIFNCFYLIVMAFFVLCHIFNDILCLFLMAFIYGIETMKESSFYSILETFVYFFRRILQVSNDVRKPWWCLIMMQKCQKYGIPSVSNDGCLPTYWTNYCWLLLSVKWTNAPKPKPYNIPNDLNPPQVKGYYWLYHIILSKLKDPEALGWF
jgi:hypothetical protein